MSPVLLLLHQRGHERLIPLAAVKLLEPAQGCVYVTFSDGDERLYDEPFSALVAALHFDGLVVEVPAPAPEPTPADYAALDDLMARTYAEAAAD